MTDSLVQVDQAGWDTLELAVAGISAATARRELSSRYGAEVAARCLAEYDALAATDGLTAPDPLASGAEGWLPSAPGAPLVKSLCLNVAHDCDFRCRYCFAGTGGFGGARALMPAEVARQAVDFLLANSGDTATLEIDFFGGEPLLNLDVVRETVDYGRRRAALSSRKLGFTLTTNAAAMGPDEAAYLAETMDNVVLSLDGRPEVHDRMRPFAGGRSSHGVVLKNILEFIARRGDRDYWVRGTYTALNLDFGADVAYLAAQGIRNISVEPVVGGPVEGGAVGGGLRDRWGLGEQHLPRLREEYLELARFIRGEETRGRPVRFFHFLAETDAGPCYAKRVRGCGAGREYLAVTPEGELFPCHQFVGRDGFSLGRLEDQAAGAAFRPVAGPGAGVGEMWLGSKPACRNCWARYRCSGGCHANAHAATVDIRQPDPLGCALLKARLEAGLYLQALRAQ